MRRSFLSTGGCVLAAMMVTPASANPEGSEPSLSELSIEELASIPVRSASKVEEPLSGASASLYVLTGEDIQSSGVTSVPEALRLAPNLQVQQAGASEYSISARGFNGLQAGNKLLVLIDGRSIYTPLASSVYWNLHSPLLEDIQQIEVISGPGGTLYGPNAVNGVVNITSRNATDTIGTLARATYGAGERTAALRHGFAVGTSGAIRFYGNWHDREGLPASFVSNVDIDDAYRGWQAGMRADFSTASDHVTVQGDLFRTDADTLSGDGARGHNILARWSHTLSEESSFELQTYYDRFKREFSLVDDAVTTLDAEAQLNVTRGNHALIGGGGLRTTRDLFVNDLNLFKLNPESRRLWVYNFFIQDRLSLTPALTVTGGVKIERSSFTGWQVLPTVRLGWQPDERTLLWGAISRAVRTPSRIDRELEAPPILAQSTGFQSEKLVALEAGYRGQPTALTTLSVNGFVNFYDDLRTTEATNGGLPFRLLNGRKGRTYGLEAWGGAQILPWWRLWLGAASLWKDLELKDGHTDLVPRNSIGNDSEWQLLGRSQVDLGPRVQLNVNARAVGRIEQAPKIGSYVEAGGRLAYLLSDRLELYVAGRNLLHRTHAESNDPGAGQLAKRSIYAGTRVRF